MTDREVQLVDLPPMRVARAIGFGTDPRKRVCDLHLPVAASWVR